LTHFSELDFSDNSHLLKTRPYDGKQARESTDPAKGIRQNDAAERFWTWRAASSASKDILNDDLCGLWRQTRAAEYYHGHLVSAAKCFRHARPRRGIGPSCRNSSDGSAETLGFEDRGKDIAPVSWTTSIILTYLYCRCFPPRALPAHSPCFPISAYRALTEK
jgi:hypothetical protein